MGRARFPGYVHPEPHIIKGTFRLGETAITPLPVPHGRINVNGYLFTRAGRKLFAYFSDCKEVTDAARAAVAGVEVLVVDALRHRPHPTHMSLDEALAVAAEIQAPMTYLTHLCHDLGHAETEKILPAHVRVAYDGLKIECSAEL